MKALAKLLTITFMAFLLASFMACSDQKADDKPQVRPVRYTEVVLGGSAQSRVFSGTTATKKTINLSFRQPGKIIKLDVKVGERVGKGQVIAQLDNIQSRLALEQGQAQLNAAESNLNTTKLTLERVRKLYEKGSASLSDFEQAKNGFQTAQKGFEAAEKGVAILKEQLGYGNIYAPTDGTISSLIAEVDENVAAGQPVAILNSGDAMEINLGIPESIINEVKVGMEVNVIISSLKNEKPKGKVTEVSSSNGQASATYPVVIELTDNSSSVKSGMAAEVYFSFDQSDESNASVPMVPTSAVGEDSDGQFVFLIQPEDGTFRAKKQRVTIGSLSSNGFEILSGLVKGQLVATAGLQTLLDSQEVKLQK